MSVNIIALGHCDIGDSDKIWGAAIATNPDGRKTGFRFWGPRAGKLSFKVCNGDHLGETSLLEMWRKKERNGYREIDHRSLDSIHIQLGLRCRENVSEIIASVMLLGVNEDVRIAG